LTNGIGWGGTNGRGAVGKEIKKDRYKLKDGSYKKPIYIILITLAMSISPYQAFTKKLLNNQEYTCINKLWHKESKWNAQAISRTHDYGIPQRHMKNHSKKQIDQFMNNPYRQILWGLNYVSVRHGSACKAWEHSQRKGWY